MTVTVYKRELRLDQSSEKREYSNSEKGRATRKEDTKIVSDPLQRQIQRSVGLPMSPKSISVVLTIFQDFGYISGFRHERLH